MRLESAPARLRGVATIELLLALPALLAVLALVFHLGTGLLHRQRAHAAARHAAWQFAANGTRPTTLQLREWTGADRVELHPSSSPNGLRGMEALEAFLPGDTTTTAELRSFFSPALRVLPVEDVAARESTVFVDFWVTPPEHEGLWGTLGRALSGDLALPF